MNITNLDPGQSQTCPAAAGHARLFVRGGPTANVELLAVEDGRASGSVTRLSPHESRFTGLTSSTSFRAVPPEGLANLDDALLVRVQLTLRHGADEQVVTTSWTEAGRLPYVDLLHIDPARDPWVVAAAGKEHGASPSRSAPAPVTPSVAGPTSPVTAEVPEQLVPFVLVARADVQAARAPEQQRWPMRVLLDASASMRARHAAGGLTRVLDLLQAIDVVHGTGVRPMLVGAAEASRSEQQQLWSGSLDWAFSEQRSGFTAGPLVRDAIDAGSPGRRWLVVLTDAAPPDLDDVRAAIAAAPMQVLCTVLVLGRSRLDVVDGGRWSDPTVDELSQVGVERAAVHVVSIGSDSGALDERLGDETFSSRVVRGVLSARRAVEDLR
jgi:hypothetical protein